MTQQNFTRGDLQVRWRSLSKGSFCRRVASALLWIFQMQLCKPADVKAHHQMLPGV